MQQPSHQIARFFQGGLAAFALMALVTTVLVPHRAGASENGAMVFMYHRFGENNLPQTNIRLEQFDAHLEEAKSGRYTVMSIPDILSALNEGRELPDRAIAFTVDDAYRSVYTEAWPRFKAAGIPFTLYVATRLINQGNPNYMSWDQIRELHAAGVTIGSQANGHLHMASIDPDVARADLVESNKDFQRELGFVPDVIAWPYGEYSTEIQTIARDLGFRNGFGQHTGVAHESSDLMGLPRAAMNEKYGDMDRFRNLANALPIPIAELTPLDALTSAQNPPFLGFTVDASIRNPQRMRCYPNRSNVSLEIFWLSDHRAEIRFADALPKGRTRINCTLLGPGGRWRWLGHLFITP